MDTVALVERDDVFLSDGTFRLADGTVVLIRTWIDEVGERHTSMLCVGE